MDLLQPKPTPVELQIKGDLDLSSLNPHGISVYTDEAGEEQIRFNITTLQNTEKKGSGLYDMITLRSNEFDKEESNF